MAVTIICAAGGVLGFLTGRWWAVLAAVPLALWVLLTTPVSPAWFLALWYGLIAAAALAGGVFLRRLVNRRIRTS